VGYLQEGHDLAQLYGNESTLDSLELVTVIIDIESYFLDKDISITLTSEKAMSIKYSPFLTVKTLSDFIFNLMGGNNE